jgi:hypothetical protein
LWLLKTLSVGRSRKAVSLRSITHPFQPHQQSWRGPRFFDTTERMGHPVLRDELEQKQDRREVSEIGDANKPMSQSRDPSASSGQAMGHPRCWLLGGLGWGRRVLVLVVVFVVGCFVVGDVLAVVDDPRGSVELLVVGVFDYVAHVDVLR